MIRLLLLLCAGIFVTLQIGGQDRGQMRFGLIGAEPAPVRIAPTTVESPAPPLAESAPLQAAGGVQAAGGIVPVVFAPAQPLITPVAQTQTVVRVEGVTFSANDDVRYVTGRSVNVRSGPSTQDAVVGRLSRGEAVRVVSVEDSGWARVRIEGDGIDGFMSLSFLADAAP
ncbi:MAG: SH3 domain-containing protein [Paracoccaceae bacterium]